MDAGLVVCTGSRRTNGRGRTGEVIDLIDLDVERERHVVPHQFEMLVVEKMLDVLPGAGVVGAEDIAAFREKPLASLEIRPRRSPRSAAEYA